MNPLYILSEKIFILDQTISLTFVLSAVGQILSIDIQFLKQHTSILVVYVNLSVKLTTNNQPFIPVEWL